jgi:hypothetical protein
MSKYINVNPDHYKVAGRERQGENIVHRLEKREIARPRSEEKQPRGQSRNVEPRGTRSRSKETARTRRPGISNRESAAAEARERAAHPPVDTSSPPPQDAAGRVGEEPLEDRRDRHTSHKAGSRSIAQKEAGARYPDRSAPPSRKVAGAFGREPEPAGEEGVMRRRPPKRARRV